jgi:hypothetical protein
MPLLSDQIADIDHARMDFIDKLNNHCHQLREELHVSELILHSVVKSLSKKSVDMEQLDLFLTSERKENTAHRPVVFSKTEQSVLLQVQHALEGATKRINEQE